MPQQETDKSPIELLTRVALSSPTGSTTPLLQHIIIISTCCSSCHYSAVEAHYSKYKSSNVQPILQQLFFLQQPLAALLQQLHLQQPPLPSNLHFSNKEVFTNLHKQT
jgi:hypothetical protein